MRFDRLKMTDIETIAPRLFDVASISAMRRDGWVDMVGRSVCSMSLVDAGVSKAAGGIIPMWQGVGHAWMLIGEGLTRRQHGMVFHKAEEMLTVAHLSHGLRRIQCDVRMDFAAGHRFALWLGFEDEGVLRRYSPDGADHVMYSRIVEAR